METNTLFVGMDLSEVGPEREPVEAGAREDPRVRRPDRRQMLMQPCCLEDALPADHMARSIWAVVERLELSGFYEPLKARGSEPGRSATDPKLLVALWLYATMEGIGSGREIARLCGCQDAYRWLCGGVAVNYHTLNDFRVGYEKALDDLFTQVLAVLMHRQVVTVKRIAQDGTKVRASAGRQSFRREGSLRRRLEEARAHVAAVKAQGDDATVNAQQRAARERAAREREERITAALAELPKIRQDQQQSRRPEVRKKEPQASMTDADARIMKMPDNGFRPAYNVQFAVDTESRAIVGVDVTNARSDHHESEPMRQQVEQRSGAQVEEHLMDGGYVQLDSIERAEGSGTKVYAPPPKSGQHARAYEPKKNDGPGVAAWRQRMGEKAAQEIYSQRASTCETVNADVRSFRGLSHCVVRGLRKVRCQALWSALAYNLLHFAMVLIT